LRFVATDSVAAAFGRDVSISPRLQQAVPNRRRNVEANGLAAGPHDLLRLEIDGHQGLLGDHCIRHQFVHHRLLEYDRQYPASAQCVWKRSSILDEITHRMPKSSSALAACACEDPSPRLGPATRILARRYSG
jgi:hypothetical protein